MFCQLFEYRLSRSVALSRALEQGYEENHRLRWRDPTKGERPRADLFSEINLEHRVRCSYVATMGEVDFMIIRRCGSFYPFVDPPRISGVSMRRSLGFSAPSEEWLRKASDTETTPAHICTLAELLPDARDSLDHLCDPEPERPFIGVVYAELARIEYLLASTQLDESNALEGPARKTLQSFLQQHRDTAALTTILKSICRGLEARGGESDQGTMFRARIAPLIGLDRVPLAFVVAASTIDEIAAVASAVRQLSASTSYKPEVVDSVSELLQTTPPRLKSLCRSRLLISTTTTTIGVHLGREESSSAPQPDTLGRSAGVYLRFHAPNDHASPPQDVDRSEEAPKFLWTLGTHDLWDEKKSRHAFCGGLITYIRQHSSVDGLRQAQLAHALRLQPLLIGPNAELHYFGQLDSVFAWVPQSVLAASAAEPAPADLEKALKMGLERLAELGAGPVSQEQRDGLAEVLQPVLGVPTPFQNEQHAFTARDILLPLWELICSDSSQSLDTSTVPYISGGGLSHSKPSMQNTSALSLLIEQSLIELQHRKYSKYSNKQSRSNEWIRRWLRLTSNNHFSYTLTTSGVHLISEVLHTLLHDPPTFGELAQALEGWVNQTHDDKSNLTRITPIISNEKLGIHFGAMEQLLDARRRRTAPIRRSSRDSTAFDTLSGYEVSRQGYASYAHAIAHFLGLREPLLVLDSSIGRTSEQHLRGLVTLLKVPASTFLVPLMWRVGSELGRVAIKDVHVGEFTAIKEDLADKRSNLSEKALDLELALFNIWCSDRAGTLETLSVAELLTNLSNKLQAQTSPDTVDEKLQPLWQLWRQLSRIFVDVPSDLLSACALALDPPQNSKDKNRLLDLRRFWWNYIPSLLHAKQETLDQEAPLSSEDLGTLLLRVSAVCYVLHCWKDKDCSPRNFRDGMYVALLAVSRGYSPRTSPRINPRTRQLPWVRQLMVLLKHLHEDLGAFRRPTPKREWWRAAVGPLIDGLARWKDGFSPRNQDQEETSDLMEDTFSSWLVLCGALYRGWPELVTHHRKRDKRDKPDWSPERMRRDMIEYLDELINLTDEINGAVTPWLPLRKSSYPLDPGRISRLPEASSPWLSYRGAIRAGWEDRNEPGTFFYEYHRLTIELLFKLARGNRVRRYSILKELMVGR